MCQVLFLYSVGAVTSMAEETLGNKNNFILCFNCYSFVLVEFSFDCCIIMTRVNEIPTNEVFHLIKNGF